MIFLLLIVLKSFAGANISPVNHGQLFLSYFNYQANSFYDLESKEKSFSQNGQFEKHEISYFNSYTFKSNWALVSGGALLQNLEYNSDNFQSSFRAVGDHTFGIRKVLSLSNNRVTSIETGIQFPFYDSQAAPAPGLAMNSYYFSFLQDFYQVFNLDFVSYEARIWLRSDKRASDNLFQSLTLGKSLPGFMLIAGASYEYSLRNESQDSNLTIVSTDYDLLKINISAVLSINQRQHLQLGVYQDYLGRNIGKGRTFFLSWWINY